MATLPSGTVTFLFTDIEGSTRLMEELDDRYGDVLAAHRRLLRDELGKAGGQEIDTQGDAFFFSFARARDAVSGAVAAQRALAAHEWPHGADVKVRMGLHTGEPTVGEEGYHGLDVVRAARICSAGHGGQVLLSETTRALLGNAVPGGVQVRDLGRQELKDVQHERLFQLTIDGHDDRFPALKTPGRRPRPRPSRAELLGEDFGRRIEAFVERSLEESFRGREAGARAPRGVREERPPPRASSVAGFVSLGLFSLVGLALAIILIALAVKAAFF